MSVIDLVIVGGGAAGLASAVRAAADGTRTAVLERGRPGGALLDVARVETVLGHPVGMSGPELVERTLEQASRFGAAIRTGAEARALRSEGDVRVLDLADGSTVAGRSVIIATGAEWPGPVQPALRRFLGSGVYLDVPRQVPQSLRAQDVFITGEPRAAAAAALRLAAHCRRVVLLSSEPAAGCESAAQRRRLRAAPGIRVRPGLEILEAVGAQRIEVLILRDRTTGRTIVSNAAAVFFMDVAMPRTAWLAGALRCDARGRINGGGAPARRPFETGMPGVFAAGGVRGSGLVSDAIEEGIGAAVQATRYLRCPASSPAPGVSS